MQKRKEKDPASMNEAIYPYYDDVIAFDPEVTLFPEPTDLTKNVLPEDWIENENVNVKAQLFEADIRKGGKGKYITRFYESKADVAAAIGRGRMIPSFRHLQLSPFNVQKELIAPIVRGLMMQEAAGLDYFGGSDSIDSMVADKISAFVPMITGPAQRQMYSYDLLKTKSLAYDTWLRNPLGKRIPSIIADFTIGRGAAAFFKDDKAQDHWDIFARANNLLSRAGGSGRKVLYGNKQYVWNIMLSVDGELFLEEIPFADTLIFRSLDSATILDIITDPLDIENIYYYHQQYHTQMQQYTTGDYPSMQYVIRQVPPDSVIHVKMNVFENEKRGRPDGYPIFGWLRRIKDTANSIAIRMFMQACQVWDVSVDGSDTVIRRLAEQIRNQPHKPGGAFVHSNKVIRQLLGPSIGGSGADQDITALYNLAALGAGIPVAYILSSMGANRAGVLAETEPSSKMFHARQNLNENLLHEMKYRLFRYLRDKRGIKVANDECEFVFPAINAYDRQAFLAALGIAEDRDYLSHKRAMVMTSKEYNINNYDVNDELNDIKQDKLDKAQTDAEIQQIVSMMNQPQQPPQGAQTDVNPESQKSGQEQQPEGQPATAPNESGGLDEGERKRTAAAVTPSSKG